MNQNVIILDEGRFNEISSKLDKLHSLISIKLQDPAKIILKEKDVIELLGISISTFAIWRTEFKLEYSEIKNHRYYKYSELLKFIENNTKKN